MANSPSWQSNRGTYIAGRSNIDMADQLAVEMERKWGAGRLRLLVSSELREKFDRQRVKFNTAIWHGELEDVRREAERMANAWRALDADAMATGQSTAEPDVWEVAGEETGMVYAIVRSHADAAHAVDDGRLKSVWTLEEIARILDSRASETVLAVKREFPGATVEAIKEPSDPLLSFDDVMDDPIPFGEEARA